MDVRKREDWQRTLQQAKDEYGRVDFLGNVAGVVNMKSEDSVVGLTDEGWDYVLDTDLRGVWLGMQAIIPHMQSNGGGKIVNISSLAALKGLENLASYSAAKAGVIGLTQQAALNYAPDNILINAICPGTIDTPILADITPEMRKQNENSHMIKRLGRPAEIAGKMAYFFSEDGDFSTGLTESVDGGWSINGRNY
jgi:NAD(P)-dependent dehydrogenase (short-subunit alcohol dehydrogenase family)